MNATIRTARLVNRKITYASETIRTFSILGIEREGVNRQGEKFATCRLIDHDHQNVECFKTLHLSNITML